MNDAPTAAEADLAIDSLPDQPYPGLRPFTRQEWRIFFGRESMVQDVVERLVARQVVAVHGDSGCGKSSLVAAGVMSFLERDQARAGGRWWTTIMRPEDRPLTNLARALAGPRGRDDAARALDILRLINRGDKAPAAVADYLGCSAENNVCVLFDQFEELFEHARHGGEAEAELVTEFLVGLAAERPKGLHAILTMRSDYLGQCAQYRGFAETVNETQYLVPRMERPALLRAVHEPAVLYGGSVDAELAARLVADAGSGQDQLPLIQHGLMLMWRDAVAAGRATLTLADYASGGDLAAQLSNHADAVMAQAALTAADEAIVEAMFRALTDRNRDGQAIRRRQTFAELAAVIGTPRDVLSRIIAPFRAADASFLRPFGDAPLADDDHVDISHEAFIRNWQRISRPGSGWLDREADDGLIWTSLRIDAAAFEKNPLARLSDAMALEREAWLKTRNETWAERYGGGWAEVSELVAASVRAARAAARRRRSVLVGAIAAAIVALALAVFAGFQTLEATRLAAEAEGRRAEAEVAAKEAKSSETISLAALSRVALLEGQPTHAVKLALAAWPRSGDEDRPAYHRALESLAAASPEFRERQVLLGHTDAVYSAEYSPDGKRIVTASGDKTARIWDPATGAQLMVLAGHRDVLADAAWSPDGKRIVTASWDSEAGIWDAPTDTLIRKLTGHTDSLISAAYSRDGKYIVTSSRDKTARVWDAETGAQLATLSGHTDSVTSADFSPDGRYVVSTSRDKTAKVWEWSKNQLDLTLDHATWVNAATYSPDGSRIVTAAQAGKDNASNAFVWDAASGSLLLTLAGHKGWVSSPIYSADGKRIVTASGDNTIRIWDATYGQQIMVLEGHPEGVNTAAFSPDGAHVVSASQDRTARVWEVTASEPLLQSLPHQGNWVASAQYSADGKKIATAAGDNNARIWDAETGTQLRLITGHQGGLNSAVFSADGNLLLTSSDDNTARIWDADTGVQQVEMMGHENKVWAANFSPDGSRVLTASWDNTVREWDARTGIGLLQLRGHENSVNSAVYSPDGSRIATASSDSSVRIWDAATGTQLLKLVGHADTVASVAFSSDGSRIVTASYDNTIREWDAATGREILSLKGHSDKVYSAVYSSDGTRIISASADKTARIWDAATGTQLRTLVEHGEIVWTAVFSPDGSRALTASDDGFARVWDNSALPKGDGFQIACKLLGNNIDLTDVEQRYGRARKLSPICGDNAPLPVDPAAAQ